VHAARHLALAFLFASCDRATDPESHERASADRNTPTRSGALDYRVLWRIPAPGPSAFQPVVTANCDPDATSLGITLIEGF